MGTGKYASRATALKNDVINALKALIETYGENGRLSLETYEGMGGFTSIGYEGATNDIVFNLDEDEDDFTVTGDYDLEALCEICDDILSMVEE